MMMISFCLILCLFSLNSAEINDQQIVRIDLNEESPISTILFTTPANVIYRLFDSGRNHNELISYNSSNGQILLSKNLDREELCLQRRCSCSNCQLIIELIEWQSPYQLLRFILNIQDINDQKPTFSSEKFDFNLRENLPIGFELPLESAFDKDLGENSRISYHLQMISSHENPFELITKPNGGLTLKVIKNLDREEKDVYEYELIAFDHGQPRQETSVHLFIQIDDINDNPVILSRTYYHLHISENTPIGTDLLHINATDRDSGLNGQINYSMTNGYPFRIDESSGILILIDLLDYEIEQSYRLTVHVRDLGENSLARFVTIDITVLDENDNVPQAFVTFVQPLINNSIISIIENSPIGQILAHISISDQDSGLNGQMTYRIEQGNEIIGIKSLDEKSFLLIIKQNIDREEEKFVIDKLILIVSDLGQPAKTIRLEYQIHIIDVNDSPPEFDQSKVCRKDLNDLKNRSIDEPLFQVHAIDRDSNENSRISYSILPPHDNSFFINNEGEVFRLDDLNESSYNLKIMAIDHGKTVQLNSTYECFLSIPINLPIRKLINRNLFQYRYILIFVSICLLIICSLVFIIYKFFYQQRQCFQPEKTYHLYVSIPKKSLHYYDRHPCDEYVHLNSDQTSENQDSFSSHSQKASRDSRPVSLSISTTTEQINNSLS